MDNNQTKVTIYSVYKHAYDTPLYFKTKDNALKYINLIGLSYKWCHVKNSVIAITDINNQYYLSDGTKIRLSLFEL